jgi:hypothetical protein
MTDPRLSLGPEVAQTSGDAVVAALDGLRPVIRVSPRLHPAAAAAVGGLYSLLARVHPHTVLEGDVAMGPNPWGAVRLGELPDRLAACRPEPSTGAARDLVIGAGADIAAADLWLGGADWTAVVGTDPILLTPADHGLGAHAAAALVAAEVMKMVLGPLGMIHFRAPGTLVWNLLDYQLAEAPDLGDRSCRPLEVVFFGTGSVGSSGAGLLACDPRTTGTAVMVDPDHYDPARNPYRYPASTGLEAGAKAAWTARLLTGAGWHAEPFEGSVAQWVCAQPQPGWAGIAVSSVDRVDSRLDVADALPATVISVGVSGLALHAQLEHTYDEYACPYCDFADEAPPMSGIEAIAAQVALSAPRVAELELGGAVLSADDVAAAVAAGRIRSEGSHALIGRRLDDLVRRAYAEVSVPVPGAPSAAVTAPYVSWMGGVLAAAELAKAARGLAPLDRRVDLDMSGVPLGVLSRKPLNPSGACLCSSPKRQSWATRLCNQAWIRETTTS